METVADPPQRAEESASLAVRDQERRPDYEPPEWPLHTGDRMGREEFHSRYLRMPENVKCELIRGVVYVMASPGFRGHASHQFALTSWAGNYSFRVPWLRGLDDGTVAIGDSDEPQPDVAMYVAPEHGGRVKHQPTPGGDELVVGAPEFALEVSVSTAATDLGAKLEMYQAAGVNEYAVVVFRQERVRWFDLKGARYSERTAADTFESHQFPGLVLDTTSLFPLDGAKLLDTLAAGMDSDRFRQFLAAGPPA